MGHQANHAAFSLRHLLLTAALFTVAVSTARAQGQATGEVGPPTPSLPGGQEQVAPTTIDGLIIIVDCSRTMLTTETKNSTRWAISTLLDAAPERLPTSLLLFGHVPAVPKNRVEIVGDLRLAPLAWRSKVTYRNSVQSAVASKDRVFLSGALNVARDVVATNIYQRIGVVIISDGQSLGDTIVASLGACADDPRLVAVQMIAVGSQTQATQHSLGQLFNHSKLSLGLARTPAELSDSLRYFATELDAYRAYQEALQSTQLAHLRAVLDQAEAKIGTLTTEFSNAAKALSAEQSKNKELTESVTKLETEAVAFNAKVKAKSEEDAETILRLKHQIDEQVEEARKLTDTVAGLRSQVKDLTEKADSATAALQTSVADLKTLQGQFDACCIQKESQAATIAGLTTQLCTCQENLKRVEAELAALKTTHEVTKTELANKERQLGDVTTELTSTKTTLNDVRTKLASTKTELDEKKERLIQCECEKCALNNALTAAQQSAIGAARELAASKRESPSTVITTPLQSGGAGPAAAGPAAAGASGGPAAAAGAGGGGAAASAGAPGGGGGLGGLFGGLLGIL